MGSDMHYYSQEVVSRSHGGLMLACKKARDALAKIDPEKHAVLIAELDRAIANGTIG